MTIRMTRNEASLEQISEHLGSCSASFFVPLGERLDITVYAAKIVQNSVRFEGWFEGQLVGLVAAYIERSRPTAFVTNVSVLYSFQRRGIATALMGMLIQSAQKIGCAKVQLEVDARDDKAVDVYRSLDFHPCSQTEGVLTMSRSLRVNHE